MNNFIFGTKVIQQLILENRFFIKTIYLKPNHQLLTFLQSQKVEYIFWDKDKFDDLFPNTNHQYIAATIHPYQYTSFKTILPQLQKEEQKPQLILVLDHLQDEYNFGSILRTAQAAGVSAVIIPDFNQTLINAQAIKAAMGFLFNIPIVKVTNLSHTILQLKKIGFWIFSSVVKNVEQKKATNDDLKINKIVLIIGNESKGVSRILCQNADFTYKLPMVNNVESLNTSNATAVLIYQIRQQQNFWSFEKSKMKS